MTRVEHVGVWVRDIDRVAAFYERHFGARIGERYENPNAASYSPPASACSSACVFMI